MPPSQGFEPTLSPIGQFCTVRLHLLGDDGQIVTRWAFGQVAGVERNVVFKGGYPPTTLVLVTGMCGYERGWGQFDIDDVQIGMLGLTTAN